MDAVSSPSQGVALQQVKKIESTISIIKPFQLGEIQGET